MEDAWRKFDLVVCRWILGLTPTEALPDAATAAMVGGCDTPSLARLAGMEDAAWSEFPRVVAAVFNERGCGEPSSDGAAKAVADDVLDRIAVGGVDLRAGIHELYFLAYDLWGHPACEDVASLAGFDNDFDLADEGLVGTPEQVTEDALAAVRSLRGRGGVRAS